MDHIHDTEQFSETPSDLRFKYIWHPPARIHDNSKCVALGPRTDPSATLPQISRIPDTIFRRRRRRRWRSTASIVVIKGFLGEHVTGNIRLAVVAAVGFDVAIV